MTRARLWLRALRDGFVSIGEGMASLTIGGPAPRLEEIRDRARRDADSAAARTEALRRETGSSMTACSNGHPVPGGGHSPDCEFPAGSLKAGESIHLTARGTWTEHEFWFADDDDGELRWVRLVPVDEADDHW